jgi:hypothetical protein
MSGAGILPNGLTSATQDTLRIIAKQPGINQIELIQIIGKEGLTPKASRQRVDSVVSQGLATKSGEGHKIELTLTPIGKQKLGIQTSVAQAPNLSAGLTKWATQKPPSVAATRTLVNASSRELYHPGKDATYMRPGAMDAYKLPSIWNGRP